MRAGLLKHQITITNPVVVSQNSFGEDVIAPAEVGTFACTVELLQGHELESMQQTWAEARYRITMRRQPGITFTTEMRATWNGRTLDLVDVRDPIDSGEALLMIAKDYA